MTSTAERKVIYNMWVHTQKIYNEAQVEYSKNYTAPFMGFGVYDDDEYARAEKEHHGNQRYLTARMDSAESFWNTYKANYSQWEVEMAIQENEGRIGELKYQ